MTNEKKDIIEIRTRKGTYYALYKHFEDEDLLKGDLSKLGFVDYVSDITNPVTSDLKIDKSTNIKHAKWIWFKVKK